MKLLKKYESELEDLREVYRIAQDQEDIKVMTLAQKQGEKVKARFEHLKDIMFKEIKCTCNTCQERLTITDLKNEALQKEKERHITK